MIVNGIIMVPIYFKFMPVSTYGAWLATGNVVAMIGLIESGFGSVITQKMSAALIQKDEKLFSKLAGANVYSAILIAIMLFLIGLLISPFVAGWINVEESVQNSITIAFIISLASASISLIVSLLGAFAQVWQETKITGLMSIIVNVLGIISLLIYLYLGYGVISLALGYLTRAILNLLGILTWLVVNWRKKKLSRPTFNMIVIIGLLKDCFYPFLSKITDVLMGNTQSFILAIFINPSLAVVYDITGKIASVSCNFVNMANSSFFGLYALTFASKNTGEINKLIKSVSNFFVTTLITALLYSQVFTKYFVHFWVGLDKYGGDLLLLFIVSSLFITQLKQYYNNLLFSGGLINKSAKLDVLSMVLFVILLLIVVKPAQIYAIPIATIGSGVVFLGLYLGLLSKDLSVDVKSLLKMILKFLLISIPIVLVNYFLNLDLFKIPNLIIYGIVFTVLYMIIVGTINKTFIKMLLAKYKNGQKK